MRAYIDATNEVPIPWLREGIHRFKYQQGQTFLPSAFEVIESCAKAIRSARRDARGEVDDERSQLDIQAMIRWSRDFAPLGIAQVAQIEGARGKREALAAGNADEAEQAKFGRRGQGAGSALNALLGGLTVVDEHNRKLDVEKVALEIWTAGVNVPPKGHPDPAQAMHGRWLATCLAYKALGREPLTGAFKTEDFERAERAINRHRQEWPGKQDTAWWDEVREDWLRTARANEARR